jgi:hypothetical protein
MIYHILLTSIHIVPQTGACGLRNEEPDTIVRPPISHSLREAARLMQFSQLRHDFGDSSGSLPIC